MAKKKEEKTKLGKQAGEETEELNKVKEIAPETMAGELAEEKIVAPEAVEEVLTAVPSEEEIETAIAKSTIDKEVWMPKTSVGLDVKTGNIKNIDDILKEGKQLLETEIVDILLPGMEVDLLLIGQSKGKFGGGQRRVFRQTQKKTQEGNKPKFATYAVVGDCNGHVGIGFGKSKETVPAREKAIRNAKKSLIRVRRGCGSWQCSCKTPHSIPFKVQGKCGSAIIELIPAPKGTGLTIHSECAKILRLAGIKDVWSTTYGQTGTRVNLIRACEHALRKLSTTKVQHKFYDALGIKEE